MRLFAIPVALGLVLLTGAPAYAAVPDNDTAAGAVAISTVPYTATLDTSEATTDAVDQQANEQCGAPATDASVWYTYTSATETALVVDVGDSSFSPGVLIATGTPGAFNVETCGPFAEVFVASPGVTYYIMLFDYQGDGAGNGGKMVLHVEEAPPPPVVSLTVDPRGVANKDGSATVSGTLSCTGEVEFSFLDVELNQRVGRGAVWGYETLDIACDGNSRPWSATIAPIFGTKFAGGKAASITFAVACGPYFCGVDFQEHLIQLSRR